MVSTHKANTGGGAGMAMPPRRNRRWAALEVSLEHKIYVTTKVDMMPGADVPTELHTGYHKLISTLKESNETCVFLLVIPLTTDRAIVDPDDIPTRRSALMRHFTTTSRIKEKFVLCGQRPGWVSTDILR